MTDIGEKLRQMHRLSIAWSDSDVLIEAADEIERLREVVKHDPDKWSFDALMFMAKRILAEVYPLDVFTGEMANKPGNEGVTFVVLLRQVIAEIEAKG